MLALVPWCVARSEVTATQPTLPRGTADAPRHLDAFYKLSRYFQRSGGRAKAATDGERELSRECSTLQNRVLSVVYEYAVTWG
jgi:hypothetical protein